MSYFCESLDIMDAIENDPVRNARKERKRKKAEEVRAAGGWRKLAYLKRKAKRDEKALLNNAEIQDNYE